ncbi:hypothetical protein B5M09_000362 [Aphanomyces astaci]|uniref:MYND-type domain-containing protein n=1 Tax=Aphanomyces astaci TaxID=112090 RepID=A0A425D122_APHAT|nr:hypothetical protein B5M09_000362 [Aphanomyces astaci]
MGAWALAGVHARQMKWFAVGQVVLLVAGVCLSIALYTVASNLGSYATLQAMLEARYVALSTHNKLDLETAFACCGFSLQAQGTCTSSTILPLCAPSIMSAVQHFCLTTLNRLLVFLAYQGALLLCTALFLAYQNSHATSSALVLDTADEFSDPTSVIVTRVCTQILVFASVAVVFCGSILVGVACDLLFATNLVTVSAVLVAFSYHAGTYIVLLGLAVLAVGVLGVYAGLTRRKKWLWATAVVLVGVTLSLLALFAAAYRIQNPQSSSATNASLLSAWTNFAPSTRHFVQEAYLCCGFAKVSTTTGDVNFTLPYLEPTWNDANNVTNVEYTPHCPPDATDGCSVYMMETLARAAAVATKSSAAVCALLVAVLVATGVLYYRQGKKKPATWQVWMTQVVMILVVTCVVVTLLGLGLVGVDVAAGTTVFTSSVIQTLFGHSIGALVVVFVTYASAVTSYGLYGSIQKILHVVLIYMGLTLGLVVLGWSSVGVVSSMTTSTLSWQPLLDTTLDSIWTGLSFDSRMFVAESRLCCGYNDPVLVGSLYQFDRATSSDGKSLACPTGLRTGCRSVLLQDAAALLGQLFELLVAFSTLESIALVTSMLLLRGLILLHRDVWVGIVKKMRWWGAKYRDDIDRHHMTRSLWKNYDAKFSRPQRLTCILCAVATLAFVNAVVQTNHGCTRTSSVECQPLSPAALLSLGLVYSLVSLVVQIAFVGLFSHIRHRYDDDDAAKVAERRRKEKVYFRDVMMQMGLGFYMFGLEVPSSIDFVVVPGLMMLSAGGVLVCTSLKRRTLHSRFTHLGLRAATGVSLVLVVVLALVVFLILQSMEEPTTPRNWTIRNTGFSVVDALRAIWLGDTSGVLRLQWQSQLGCCGFPEFPARPCPPGPSTQQNVTATKVDGTIIVKRITVVADLGGCQDKMLAQVQSVAQIVLAVLIVMGVMELLVAACTTFLARDILISWDAKLRHASVKKTNAVPPADELFDMSPATIAPPQRGCLTSSLVQTSIDNVSEAVATALAQTPLSPHTRLVPMSHDKLQRKLNIRYPSWIVKVVYVVCGVWCAGFGGGAIFIAWDLSDYAALPWLGVFVWSAVLHGAVVEPAYVFGLVMSKTLSAWWKQTWMAALIGMGKAILHLDDAATPDDATVIMDPFLRIRHSSALVIQRRWLAKLARLRYLVILRVARENAHRVAVESRARQVKAAIAGFTREEMNAFAVLFRDADHAKTGLVSYKVVSHAVYALGVKVPTAVVKQYLEALDRGFVDLIDQDYFMYAMSCIRGYHQDQQAAQVTTDEIVVSSSLQGKTQIKKQNMLRDLKDKRTTISKQLMNKVEKLTSKLRADSDETEDAKPSGAYILLNTKKTMANASPPRTGNVRQATIDASNINSIGTATAEGRKIDTDKETVEQVQQAVRPTPKALLSVRATKDMEKAIHQMKLKQKSKNRNSVPTNARGVSSPHQEADEATHLLVLPPRRVQAGENVSWNHSTNVRSYRRENPAMPQVQQKQQLVLERQAWDLQLARLNVVPSEHTAAWDASTNVKSTRVVSPLQQELKDANPTSDDKSISPGDAVRRTKWCAGCNQGVVSAQRCSQCKRAFFCSTACQKTGWLKHKAQCRAISVEPSVAALWSPMLTATRSSNTDESYRAFSTIQAWMASDSTAATVFRGLNGVSMFLQHLESVDLESTCQSLLLITRFVESSADIAEDVVLMGGVATLVSLAANALDFRIQASAVVAVGSLIASFHDPIALTRHLVNDLDAISALLRVLHQASPLEDDVELVACVQSTAILLQLLEHHPDALSQLATFQTPDEDDVGALLTGLVGRVDTIYRLNRSATKGVPVGHHLYLNLLALTGALVHAYPECKPQFVVANVVATICTTIDKHCQLPPLPNTTIMDVLTAWIMWFIWTFIYDWRVRLMTSEAMDILDRLVPLLTPFLSLPAACDDFTANHRGIHLASSVLRHVVDSDANLAPRTRLSALDLFVCAILPPFDVPEADRQRRIEANVDVIVGTLDHVLTRTLAFLDPNSSEKDTTLATMFLAEAVKCTGLVAHFGQAMPPVDHTNLPRTLAQVLQHENVLEDVKWIAMAALIQWVRTTVLPLDSSYYHSLLWENPVEDAVGNDVTDNGDDSNASLLPTVGGLLTLKKAVLGPLTPPPCDATVEITKPANLGSNAIASNVAGYLDPNIQSYIRSTWWPLAHFNPITFKKDKDLDITKDDYVRFNCKVYRSLLPDITDPDPVESNDSDDANPDVTPTTASSSVISVDRTMDFHLFSMSVLDLATSCTAGGMDALYLFLQSLRIKYDISMIFMDMHVKAIDSSKSPTDPTPTWILRNMCAGALVYKTTEIDITSIQYETLEYFVLPTTSGKAAPSTADTPKPTLDQSSYQMTCVLQDTTAVEFEGTFYGSVAAKRVRVFGLQHPSAVPLILTVTTEPTKQVLTAGRDGDGRRAVIGCIYLVQQSGLASYKFQQHKVLYDYNSETKAQIICEAPSPKVPQKSTKTHMSNHSPNIDKLKKAARDGGGASLNREVELIHEYFEHMAKTQPTFDELKKLDAAYANRYNQADQLSDDFNSVYHDDSELKKTSAKAKSAKFGVDDDRPPQDSVFASEEYSHAATYLEVG